MAKSSVYDEHFTGQVPAPVAQIRVDKMVGNAKKFNVPNSLV
ncbi:MAG TPA: hypothetical protein V6D12_09090 [Candidatus Obscuribacterales bacterium]